MFEQAAPRTPAEATNALVPGGATYSIHRLLDAMRTLPMFGNPRMPGFTGDDPQQVQIGRLALWTYDDAATIITHAYGPEGPDNLRKAVAVYRDQSVADLDDVFLLRIGFLLRGGWNFETDLRWTVHALAGNTLPLTLVAAWLGMWSIASLDACIRSGLKQDALEAIVTSGALPAPEAISTLAALRADPADLAATAS